ncbi:acetylcholine receptor subunit beta-like 1 [Dermatophagoides pteronyssinus]|uniref:acetylcholine receptor subunit beta-like 1 n=1 Tax=Dermatophagoides pteronyssinus TaxID=6956 RepID=UPI003F666AA4
MSSFGYRIFEILLSFFIIVTFISINQIDCDDSSIEIRNHIVELRKELFKNRGYDIMARPVKNYTHPVNVSIYLDINYIKNLDIQTNMLETEGWLRLSWIDENLKWKRSEYGGIEDIRVHVDEVFRPDITIINSADSENIIRSTTHSDLILWFSGDIFWMPALSMKTICEIDLTEWPFDQQTCLFRFASWTYDGDALNLVNVSDKIDLTSFSENSEWDIIDSSCEYMVHDTNEGGQFFPEVVFSINIHRKTSIYRYVVYFPIISVLFLNLMALFLDVRNPLRFHLSILCFITLLLIALFLGNKLGFGSLGIPKVIKYIGQMIILTTFTLLWFAFSLNFIRSTFEIPAFVMRSIEPLQHYLISKDIESVQLTNNDLENGQTNQTSTKSRSNISQSNLIIVQIVDKILFVLFFILIIALHN